MMGKDLQEIAWRDHGFRGILGAPGAALDAPARGTGQQGKDRRAIGNVAGQLGHLLPHRRCQRTGLPPDGPVRGMTDGGVVLK